MSENVLVEDLRAWWLAIAELTAIIGQRVHYLHVPQSYKGAYLYYARATAGDDDDRCLDDQPGSEFAFREAVDVEAISRTAKEAERLALLLRKLDSWSKWSGPVGGGTVQAVYVRDHNDQYVPMGTGGDEGLTVGAVRFELVGYQAGA